jgi:shikimate dehydrogenase
MARLAVVGYPVSHSRSPAMHNAALAELGLAGSWSYEAIEVAPEHFADLVRSLADDGFAGVNVTVPHKLAALALADSASEAAREIGAANTLSISRAGIAAENTDAGGLLAALGEPQAGRRALVLGAGGSARAAAWALRNAGAEVYVWNRTASRAEALAAELEVAVAATASADYDLVINATTIGLEQASLRPPEPGDLKALPFDADSIDATQTVVDLVYGPHETALSAHARASGARLIDGLDVLVHQGAASLRIWTGLDPPLGTMRKAAGIDRNNGNRESRRTSSPGPPRGGG